MLHVLVSGTCNNNCLFCMETDRDRRRELGQAQSPRDIRAMIGSYPSPHGILFTSGEPTLSPELLGYVRLARERGFRDIAVITNGRCLAYAQRAKALVDAGVNRITVSIHGHDARLHDGLTRTPGSFEQTVAGLENLRALPVRVHTSTVVTRRNLPHVESIFRMLVSLGVEVIVLNVMMPKGRGAEHLHRLMPRYRDVVTAVNALCAGLTGEELARLRVEDVPECIGAQLPAAVRGRPEAFHQFELVGSSGLGEIGIEAEPAIDQPTPDRLQVGGDQVPRGVGERDVRPGQAICTADLAGDGSYYLTDRRFKEQFLRVRGEPCATCARDSCPGVWSPYVEAFGWDEFVREQGAP